MRVYQIPNTDNTTHLTRTLKFNFLKYRTLLHFMYKNKSFYKIEDEEVRATDDFVIRECGSIVCKVANVKLCWKKVWSEISKDEDFMQHVNDMFEATDITEFLSGIIPCGITRCMHEIVQFAESLKKCYDELTKETEVFKVAQNIKNDYETLSKWLVEFDKDGSEVFTIPSTIYELTQKYAEDDSPNFTEVIDYIILNSKANRLLRPYVWATVMEQFHDIDVELPAYEPHSALQYATLNSSMNMPQLDDSVQEIQDTSKPNERSKAKFRGNKRKVDVDIEKEDNYKNEKEGKQIVENKEKGKGKRRVVRKTYFHISTVDKEEKHESSSEEILENSDLSLVNKGTKKIKKVKRRTSERISGDKNESKLNKDKKQGESDIEEISDSIDESEETKKIKNKRITRGISGRISPLKIASKIHKDQEDIVEVLDKIIDNTGEIKSSIESEKIKSKDDDDLKGLEDALDKWLNDKNNTRQNEQVAENKSRNDNTQEVVENSLDIMINNTDEPEEIEKSKIIIDDNQKEVESAIKALINSECNTENSEKAEELTSVCGNNNQEIVKSTLEREEMEVNTRDINCENQDEKNKNIEKSNINDNEEEVESILEKVIPNKDDIEVIVKQQENESVVEEDENQVENAIDEFLKELSGRESNEENEEVIERRVTRSLTGSITPVKGAYKQPEEAEEQVEICETSNEINKEIIEKKVDIAMAPKKIFTAKKKIQKVKKDSTHKSSKVNKVKETNRKERPSCESEQEQDEYEEDTYISRHIENKPRVIMSISLVPGMVVEDWEMQIRFDCFRFTPSKIFYYDGGSEEEIIAPTSRKRRSSRNAADSEKEPKKMKSFGIIDLDSNESLQKKSCLRERVTCLS